MHLEQLEIYNFRAISKLSIKFSPGANLLVGPNAVGKTTLLEAIRLNKAILAPRTQQENRNVMIGLGLTSAQLPQLLNFSAIAGDPKSDVVINCAYKLSSAEISQLPILVGELARTIAAAQVGILPGENGQIQRTRFFSSPVGQQALQVSSQFVQDNIGVVAKSGLCNLNVTIDQQNSQFNSRDIFAQVLFSALEAKLNPYRSLFSYFSADRSMPSGDAQIQLGTVDAQQQLESHNSTPNLKFQRMKSTIFSSFVESEESRDRQSETFKLIFKELLKEKEIAGFNVNQFGQASIVIRDKMSGREFDIDSLSSGEKGLILTFLILSRSIEKGGNNILD